MKYCENCNKQLIKENCFSRRVIRKFCSNKCRLEAQRKKGGAVGWYNFYN